MRWCVSLALLVVAATALPTDNELFAEYKEWALVHGKDYGALELSKRFENYKSNWNLVRHYNRIAQGETTFALNDFADLSQEEFAAMYLRPINVPVRRGPFFAYNPENEYPAEKDWRNEGAVNAVKNQGSCGSCWAFSTNANVEGVYFVAHKQLLSLSEQQLVDCDHYCMIYQGEKSCDSGCGGGLMVNALNYTKDYGLMLEKEYSYKGKAETCHYDAAKATGKITGFVAVDAKEDAMVAALNELGPLSIGVDANTWSFYTGGIYGKLMPCGSKLNHGVALVGYGTHNKEDFWIIRNSWGGSWGEKGYMRLIRGKNKCGVDNYVNSATISA